MDIENPAELLAYLRAEGRIAPDEEVECAVLAGGVSNRTVRVRRPGGEAWVLKQALRQLRVEVEWQCSEERLHQEALGLEWFARIAPGGSVPRVIFEDRQRGVLAMEAVDEPHENFKGMLMRGELQVELVREFGAMLGAVHRGAAERAGELRPVFEETCYFEALRLEPYFLYGAERCRDVQTGDWLRALAAETRGRRFTLVHGDYSPKNVLVRAGRLVLLDYEVVHWGDPGFDIGFALAHLLSKAHYHAGRRGEYAAAAVEFWRAYREAAGPGADLWDVDRAGAWHGLGCLLARVCGRSRLEYLDDAMRERQRAAVVRLAACPPPGVEGLIAAFVAELR